MPNAPSRPGRLRRPLVVVALLGLAACGSLEPGEAREAAQEVARATREVAQATKELTQEQLAKVDPEALEQTVDGVAGALGARSPAADAAGSGGDPLADAAQAIACDEARTRCTVTADFADRVRQHGRRVAEQIGVSPASGERGLRIHTLDAGSIVHLVGLKVGDVVTHVNGRALGSAQDAALLYLTVRAARSLVIDYRRGGEARTLQLDVV